MDVSGTMRCDTHRAFDTTRCTWGVRANTHETQVQISGLYSTKYLGGFDISKQRRVQDDTPGPVQLVPAELQRRALTLILRVVAGDGGAAGDASFLPAEEDFSNLATWDGYCEGLGQYCYGVVPVDVLSEVCTLPLSLSALRYTPRVDFVGLIVLVTRRAW